MHITYNKLDSELSLWQYYSISYSGEEIVSVLKEYFLAEKQIDKAIDLSRINDGIFIV